MGQGWSQPPPDHRDPQQTRERAGREMHPGKDDAVRCSLVMTMTKRLSETTPLVFTMILHRGKLRLREKRLVPDGCHLEDEH